MLACAAVLLAAGLPDLALAAGGVRAYIRSNDGQIFVVDTETETLVGTVDLPAFPTIGLYSGASPDHGEFYFVVSRVTGPSQQETRLVALDTATHQVSVIENGPPIGFPHLGTFSSGVAVDTTLGRVLVGSPRFGPSQPPGILHFDLAFHVNVTSVLSYSADLDGMSATPMAIDPTGTRLLIAQGYPRIVELNPPSEVVEVTDGWWYRACSGDAARYCSTDDDCAGAGSCSLVGSEPRTSGGAISHPSGATFWATGVSELPSSPRNLLMEVHATGAPGRHVQVGESPNGLDITPDGATIFVANSCGTDAARPCQSPGTVSVVDTASATVTNTITVGYFPLSVAVDPDGDKVFVVNACGESPLALPLGTIEPCSPTVSVIDIATGTVTKTIALTTEVGVFGGSVGKFLASVPSYESVNAVVGTGTRWMCVQGDGTPSGLTSFDLASHDVFGTAVDLGTLVGTASLVPDSRLLATAGGFTSYFASENPDGLGFEERGELNCPIFAGCSSTGNRYTAAVDSWGLGTFGMPVGVDYALVSDPMVPATCPLELACPPDTCLAGPVTVTAAARANTAAGFGIRVRGSFSSPFHPTVGVSVEFQHVTNDGVTVVVPIGGRPTLFAGAGIPPFDISTTAEFTGLIEVCVRYSGSIQSPRLLHGDSATGGWVDVTSSVDTTTQTVCGRVTSLSPFSVIDAPPIGFVPTGSASAKCASGASKAVAKLHGAIGKCHAGAGKAALRATAFDEAACEVKARAAYDTAIGRLTGCAPCQGSAAGALGEAIHTAADVTSGGPYCSGSVPLGDDEIGYLPTNVVEDLCAKKLTIAADRLVKKVLVCRTKAATAALKGKAFDRVACEDGASASYQKTVDKLTYCPACLRDSSGLMHDQSAEIGAHAFRELYCDGSTAIE